MAWFLWAFMPGYSGIVYDWYGTESPPKNTKRAMFFPWSLITLCHQILPWAWKVEGGRQWWNSSPLRCLSSPENVNIGPLCHLLQRDCQHCVNDKIHTQRLKLSTLYFFPWTEKLYEWINVYVQITYKFLPVLDMFWNFLKRFLVHWK